jgi:hypothetical protein
MRNYLVVALTAVMAAFAVTPWVVSAQTPAPTPVPFTVQGTFTGTFTPGTPTTPPVPTPPAAVIDLSQYTQTFGDDFTSLNTMAPNGTFDAQYKWWNGVEQCCMSPLDQPRTSGAMYPTIPWPSTSTDAKPYYPYSLTPPPPPASTIGIQPPPPPPKGLDITDQYRTVHYVPPAGATCPKDANGECEWSYWLSGVFTSVDGTLGSDGHGFMQQYGYAEMRAKVPEGAGTWPSFFMLSSKVAPAGPNAELDVIEHYGQFHDTYCSNWHDYSANSSIGKCTKTTVADLAADYHMYGVAWDENNLAFYFDRKLLWSIPTPTGAKQPFYFLVANGVGGGWPTNTTPNPSIMSVDYIHVYKHN